VLKTQREAWLGREGSNLRIAESKSAALPLGYAPSGSCMFSGKAALRDGQNLNSGASGIARAMQRNPVSSMRSGPTTALSHDAVGPNPDHNGVAATASALAQG
jgi:hypothetical protein